MAEQETLSPERELAASTGAPLPRDPDDASRALGEVQELLRRHQLVEELAGKPHFGEDGEPQAPPGDLQRREALNELRARLEHLHPADVAYILEALPLDERLIVWDLVKAERDGEILLEVSDAVRETLIDSMDRDELVDAVESLDADEIADLAPDLPEEVVQDIIESQDVEERAQLQSALSYPEGSVGALMDFDVVSLRDDVSVEAALRYLRRYDELPGHTDALFVVDRADHL